jgi:hypothetical protein
MLDAFLDLAQSVTGRPCQAMASITVGFDGKQAPARLQRGLGVKLQLHSREGIQKPGVVRIGRERLAQEGSRLVGTADFQ